MFCWKLIDELRLDIEFMSAENTCFEMNISSNEVLSLNTSDVIRYLPTWRRMWQFTRDCCNPVFANKQKNAIFLVMSYRSPACNLISTTMQLRVLALEACHIFDPLLVLTDDVVVLITLIKQNGFDELHYYHGRRFLFVKMLLNPIGDNNCSE